MERSGRSQLNRLVALAYSLTFVTGVAVIIVSAALKLACVAILWTVSVRQHGRPAGT